MASSTNRWKLGLFVVSGVVLAFTAATWLGTAQLRREVRSFVTYVDESVQGLEAGAPVKFRGVTLGAVKDIRVAPDRRHVQLEMEIYLDAVKRLGVTDPEIERIGERAGLRAQIASAGITGVKFVLVDYFDPERSPVPELPFPTPANYLPAAASTMRDLEQGLTESLEKIPEALERATAVLGSIETTITDLDVKGVRTRIEQTLNLVDEQIAAIGTKSLSERAATLLEEASAAVIEARRIAGILETRTEGLPSLVSRLESAATSIEEGVREVQLASTAASFRAAADGVADATGMPLERDLDGTLRSLRDASDAIRRLALLLERDPQSLLLGKSPASPPR